MVRYRLDQRGFSILELIVVAALIGILAATGGWSYRTMKLSSDGTTAVTTVVESFRRAQSNARSESRDLPWGIRISGQTVTLFAGSTYAGRTVQYDETATLPTNVTIASTHTDTIFAALTGNPDVQTQVTLTDGLGRVSVITVNAYGLISY